MVVCEQCGEHKPHHAMHPDRRSNPYDWTELCKPNMEGLWS